MFKISQRFHCYYFSINKYIDKYFKSSIRHIYYMALGAKINPSTCIPRMTVNWPHQLQIGQRCVLEDNLYFKYDGIWTKGPNIIIGNDIFIGRHCEFNISKQITIGNDTLIASGCKFIDHNHCYSKGDEPYRLQTSVSKEIIIGSNVWIGVNSIILAGVEIGDNSIVAAGSVVTKNITHNELWAGVPATKIKQLQR